MRLREVLAAVWVFFTAPVFAEDPQYPVKPVKIIAPLGPAADITTRLIAHRLGDASRVGAAGTVGAQAASKGPCGRLHAAHHDECAPYHEPPDRVGRVKTARLFS